MATSVVETFLTVFGVDLKPLQQGAAQAKKINNDLGDQLKPTRIVTDQLGESFRNMVEEGAKALIAVAAVHHIISETMEAAKAAQEIGNLSEKLGTSAEDITSWGLAARDAGGSAKGMQASMESLRSASEEMALTGENAMSPVMRLIGVDFLDASRHAKPLMQILPELADRFSQMKDKGRAFELGKQLGLDQGTVMLLMKGRMAVEEMVKKQKELGTITKEDTEAARKFNIALDEFGFMGRMVWTAVMTDIQPALTWFADKVVDLFGYLREHKGFVIGAFAAIATVITAMMVPAIISMAAAFWATGIPELILLFAAIGAAIGLVVDDIDNFLDGNESVIGHLKDGWQGFVDWFKNVFKWLGQAAQDFVDTYLPFINDILHGIDVIQRLGTKAASYIFDASTSPINGQTAQSVANSKTTTDSKSVQIDNINIQSGANPHDINKAVSGSLQEHLMSTITNNDDGVAA